MPKRTMGLGVALILTGVTGYVATEAPAVSVLLTLLFGALILVCGVMASMNEALREHILYAAAALAVAAFLSSAGALRFLLYMISVGPEHVPQPGAVIVRSVTAILCAVYLYVAIRSFIATRRNRIQ